jgi:hypothetical protein
MPKTMILEALSEIDLDKNIGAILKESFRTNTCVIKLYQSR